MYSSFLRPAEQLARAYGLSTCDVLVEAARRAMAAGQEGMLLDTALSLRAQSDSTTEPETPGPVISGRS